MLVDQLPVSSRYRAAAKGAPNDRWGTTDYLLAHLADLQQQLYRLTFVIGVKKRPPEMDRLPRPGEKIKRKRPSFLRLVDDETGEEVLDDRAEGEDANARARALLPGLAPKKKPPEVTGSPQEG